MMPSDDLDRVMMIQIQWWWSRSSDDPDPVMMPSDDLDQVMMIQQWWSRSSDDLDPVMMSHDDLDREMIQIRRLMMTWRWRWLEDEDELKMTQRRRWSSWYREEDQCWKLCRKNTFLVKRECWCICNFRMYSSMYLMYCNLMFNSRCIYYAFDPCCHTSMFQSGGSIM